VPGICIDIGTCTGQVLWNLYHSWSCDVTMLGLGCPSDDRARLGTAGATALCRDSMHHHHQHNNTTTTITTNNNRPRIIGMANNRTSGLSDRATVATAPTPSGVPTHARVLAHPR